MSSWLPRQMPVCERSGIDAVYQRGNTTRSARHAVQNVTTASPWPSTRSGKRACPSSSRGFERTMINIEIVKVPRRVTPSAPPVEICLLSCQNFMCCAVTARKPPRLLLVEDSAADVLFSKPLWRNPERRGCLMLSTMARQQLNGCAGARRMRPTRSPRHGSCEEGEKHRLTACGESTLFLNATKRTERCRAVRL